MKFLHFLVLSALSLNLTFCNPLSLDAQRDGARGESNFPSPPDITEIDPNAIVEAARSENCTKYSGGGIFLFGDFSLARPLFNCAVKAIDAGLKPLCEQEKNLKEALRYYERERDQEAVADIEEQLYDIEDSQYEIADYIYMISDGLFDWAEDLEGRIYTNDDAGFIENALERFGGPMAINAEVRGFGRNLDLKARRVCIGSQIDFDKIRNRR